MTQLFGVDVSHWQGKMDWERSKEAGVQFAFIKATEGLNYVDTQFKANVDGCKANNIPFAVYHFWRSLVTPQQQFNNIMCAYDDIRKAVPIAIDVEVFDGLTPEHNKSMLVVLIEELIKETKMMPTLYTRKSIWDSNVAPYKRWKELPLWVGNWDASSPVLPRDWTDWLVWQYKVSNDGYKYGAENGKQIDLNYVKPEYLEYYGIGVEEPEQPILERITELTINGVRYVGELRLG